MSMQSSVAEPFISGLYFGECPRWHEGRLWYSDFFDHGVFSVSPDGDRRTEVEFAGEPAGLGWLPDGRLLINSRLDRVVIRRETDGSLVLHGELAPWAQGHANDMVVASNGQAYAGNFGFELSHGATLVIAESMGGCLTAFDRSPDGVLSGRREWAALPEGVAPDGICLCEDNTIWVANALGADFVRVAEGGEIVEKINTATGLGSFACMLGGEDRKTLFMITAETSDQVKAQEKRTGCIETARTTVPGAGLP
jgi:sugar lactone lactonase YvrE